MCMRMQVSGATSEYNALLAELPEVMVGSGEQLAAWLKLVHNEVGGWMCLYACK